MTTGSQEAMYVTLKTLLDPAKDELLVVEPAFPSYVKMATLENVAVRSVAMLEDDDFGIDADRILAAHRRQDARDRDLLAVQSDGSHPLARPSGAAGSRAREARRRADLADSRRDLSRADIYDRCRIFGRTSIRYTIVTNSLSKSNALTGLRLGWILAPHAFVEQAIKAHAWVTSCADSFAQNVALHVFTTLEGVREHAPWYIEQRTAVAAALRESRLRALPIDGSFYACVRLPDGMRFARRSHGADRKLRRIGDSRRGVRPDVRIVAAFELGRTGRPRTRRHRTHRGLLCAASVLR